MVDSDIHLQQRFLPSCADHDLLTELIEATPWRQDKITVFGKQYLQPRLVAWYGDEAVSYTYSGLSLVALAWTDALIAVKRRIESVAGHRFNSVLLNYYRDQRDSMGMHSDDEPELGEQPVIASLSLGEERTLVLKHKYRKDVDTVKLPLASGSLLVMKGDTQRHWKHGIHKERRQCGPRVNLTFRAIVQSAER